MSNVIQKTTKKSKYEEALFLFRKVLKTLILSKDENNLLRKLMYKIVMEHEGELNPRYSTIYESIKAMDKNEDGWYKFAKIEVIEAEDEDTDLF